MNYLSLNVGTAAPRSVVPTPKGIYFINIAGPFFINPLGAIRPVVYSPEQEVSDIVAPFQNCTEFSRACAAYSGSLYRVCLDTTIRGTTARRDYWFDELRKRWNGPHTFTYDCAGQHANHFILCSNASTNRLFHSFARTESGVVFTDDGAAFTGTLQSSALPKTGKMTEKQVVESTLELSGGGAVTTYSITWQDGEQNTIDTASLTVDPAGGLWGSFVWNDGTLWSSAINIVKPYTIPWNKPLVFKKGILQVAAVATDGLSIGSFFTRYQDCGYVGGAEV